jgi:Caspase domain
MKPSRPQQQKRTRVGVCVGALLALCCALLLWPDAAEQQSVPARQPIFEIELPELAVAPTEQAELTIPTPTLNQVVLHILRPVADNISYGQIGTSVNGQASAAIMEIAASESGKLVRLNLNRFPGFALNAGRNSIEVRAMTRQGRLYYASFVLRTVTENRNQDFVYRVEQNDNAQRQVPPELVLLEPESEVVLPVNRRSRAIRIAGVATAATSVSRVTVNGDVVPLKRGAQVTTRSLGLANETNRVSFDTTYTVAPGVTQLLVEAVDAAGNKTQLQVPVRAGAAEQPTAFSGRKYALVIGLSKFRNHAGGLNDLKFADADARAVYQFLQLPAGGRFAPGDMLLLLNEQATSAAIRQALTSFVSKPGPDDLLLIFMAGHGAPDPYAPQNLYFLAHDTDVENMAQTALPMKDFQKLLDEHVRARRLVLLVDTCHSGGLTGAQGEAARGIANNLINLYVEKLLYQEEGKAVITSSDVNEVSQESPRWGNGHGVFTYFLLEGLQGKADLDGDQLVTVGELFRYVRQRVRLDTQFRQNPRMLAGTNETLALAAVNIASKGH